jgi:hypothetical protein
MNDDIALAFGPITALVMKRKRAMRAYEEVKNHRWHGAAYLSAIRNIEIEILLALWFGE